MKNEIKKQVIESNLVEYFANSISSSEFIDKFIRPIINVTEEQEEKISDILSEYNRDWDNAECDAEGATQEQDAELDRIIEKCSKAIANVVAIENYMLFEKAENEFLDWMRANNADKEQQLVSFIATERKEMIVRFFLAFGKPAQFEGIGKEIANATYDYFLKGKEMTAEKVANYVYGYFKY